MSDPAKVFLGNPDYDGQLVRTLTAALAGAADLGEALATARRVDKLDGASWYDAWSRTATVARAAGDAAKNAGSRVSARHAFLRASEYFRQAYYFIRSDLDDPRLQSAYRAHVETFSAATELMDHPAEHVRIPYEGTTISGYLFAPDASGAARPTLLFPCGYDSTAEAGWTNVPSALQRSYNVLVFEGPGQGEALFTQRLFFRIDYEKVLTPVIDWLQGRREVDASRIALVGRSFAGYLAPRGAAFEHRLAALVCDPAQPDMGAHLPEGLVGKVAVPVVEMQVRFSGARAEFFGARMAAHGLDSIDGVSHRASHLQHASGRCAYHLPDAADRMRERLCRGRRSGAARCDVSAGRHHPSDCGARCRRSLRRTRRRGVGRSRVRLVGPNSRGSASRDRRLDH